MTKRRSLRLLPHDQASCGRFIVNSTSRSISTLSVPRISRFVRTWNNLSSRDDTPHDILHYMISKRKNVPNGPGWEKLGRDAGGDFKAAKIDFSEDQFKILDLIYEDFQVASDNYALDADVARVGSKNRVARRTGRIVPPMILAAAMIQHRGRRPGNLAAKNPGERPWVQGYRSGCKRLVARRTLRWRSTKVSNPARRLRIPANTNRSVLGAVKVERSRQPRVSPCLRRRRQGRPIRWSIGRRTRREPANNRPNVSRRIGRTADQRPASPT